MNTTSFVKYAGAVLALALCWGCSLPFGSAQGSPAQGDMAPSAAAPKMQYIGKTLFVNGTPVTAARMNLTPPPRYASLYPDLVTKSTFEYVINFYGSYASIFDYPKSTKQIGTINNVGGQGCTNRLWGYGKRTFWIVAGDNQISLYLVPKTLLRTLSVPSGMPSSCAMNFAGDLAVGILNYTNAGDVVIFKHAGGSGTYYPTPLAREYFDGYDNKGNLFADGFTPGSGFALVELPSGGTKFRLITTSNTVGFPGSVQWDGKYLTVLDQYGNFIYQYTVSGTRATLKNTLTLKGAGDCAQSWIVGGLVYCGDASNNNGSVYKYPAGGSPVAVFTGNFVTPLGVVAAKK